MGYSSKFKFKFKIKCCEWLKDLQRLVVEYNLMF